MGARPPLELLFVLGIACGAAPGEDLGRTSASLDVTKPACDLGIDDTLFRQVESMPLVLCPPDRPYVCRTGDATGWRCRERACAPSCEQIGCPGSWMCVDCGGGAECAPPGSTCAD